MLDLLIKLILAHLIGDFVFQPKKWVASKEEKKYKSKFLYAHILVHFLSLLVLLQFNIEYAFAFIVIVISHFIIDLSKLLLNDKFKNNKRLLFFIDQSLHFIIIFIVIHHYYPSTDFISILLDTKLLLLVAFLIFVIFTSNIILMVILSKWNLTNTKTNTEESLENAGKYIGILERVFIFFLVVFNYPLGIGILITAKSVFRYNDLTRAKDRKLTEYVLIGSMISFGLAIFAGLAYSYVVNFI